MFHLIERQADVRFPRKSILFPCYVKELSIHVHCVCLAESINKWVERMAVRGGWRPLSGLICEIVNSVGQGNFTFVREKSGKSQGISNTYGCGNHVGCVVFILFNLCLIKLVGVTFIHKFISKLGPSSFECVVAIFTHGKTVFLVSRLNCI